MEDNQENHNKSVFSKHVAVGIIASLLLLAGIVGVTVTCFVLEHKVLKFHHHYSVVFDAGSSHTDITIYRSPIDKKDDGAAYTEQYKHATCSDSGVATLEKNPTEAGKMIRKCIDTIALKSLPHKDVKQTGVYVGATGGMRLLCERNPTACDHILDSIKQALNLYKFRPTRNRVRILSGTEEATFGWITVNLLTNSLKNELTPESNIELIGSLDVGGASAEVAFIPDNITIPQNYMSHFTLYGQKYALYTHSYLCYGFRESQRRLMAHLVEASNYTKNIIHPCWHKGYNETVPANWVWLPPCVKKVPPMPITNVTMYRFIGNGSLDVCENRIRELFDKRICDTPGCTFDGVFQPSVKGRQFMAHSGFGHIGKFINISKGDDLRTLKDKGEAFCEKHWETVKKLWGVDKYPKKILRSLCFEVLYTYLLLTYGFNFEPESKDIQFTRNVNGVEVGWSLGFVVNATNSIPTESPTYRLTKQEFIAILIICSTMALIGLAMLTICFVKRKIGQNMKYKYSAVNN